MYGGGVEKRILKDEKIHRLLGIIRKYEDKYEDSEFGSDISL